MRIIQILTNFTFRDAITNDVIAINETLRKAGYSTEIMAVKEETEDSALTKPLNLSSIKSQDLIIFHKSTGDALTKKIAGLSCKKVMIYHNITPAKFFLPYDFVMAGVLWMGKRQLKKYIRYFDYGWGDSNYNCKELISAGMDRSKVTILPIILPNKTIEVDDCLLNKLKSQPGVKLLYIGRISPQKKYEDIIKIYWYVLQIDSAAKLYLIGKWAGMEKYYAKLKGFCADLHLSDEQVIFTGSVTEEQKEAYLQGADVLVCMSEHEGFCIPLLEAMKHKLPIIAYAATAIPETLSINHPLLYNDKNYEAIAEQIIKLKKDESCEQQIVNFQLDQVKRFDEKTCRMKLLQLVENVICKMQRN